MALAVPPGGPEHLPVAAAEPAPTRVPHARDIPAPRLSVVVVNFCQWRNTARLVRQLRRSDAARVGAAEIVVVDNHSPPHPVARILRRMRGVTLKTSARNRGFATAANRGMKHARGEWVLLLNPDVSVADGFLDRVLAAAGRSSAGVVGFRLENADGSRQASAGPFPTLLNTLTGLFRPRGRRKCRHQGEVMPAAVAWVTGGCLLARRDCVRAVGGLDEEFFLYYEDVDFCRRAAAAGWAVEYDPAVSITHHSPLHTRRVPAPLRVITRHALLAYARKHWPGWQATLLGGLVWAEAAARGRFAAADDAECYRHLRGLVGDILRGRERDARRRVRFAAAFLAPVAAAQDLPA